MQIKKVFATLCTAVFLSFYSPKTPIMLVLCTSFAPDLPLFNAPAAVQTPSQGRHSAPQPVLHAHIATIAAYRLLLVLPSSNPWGHKVYFSPAGGFAMLASQSGPVWRC